MSWLTFLFFQFDDSDDNIPHMTQSFTLFVVFYDGSPLRFGLHHNVGSDWDLCSLWCSQQGKDCA